MDESSRRGGAGVTISHGSGVPSPGLRRLPGITGPGSWIWILDSAAAVGAVSTAKAALCQRLEQMYSGPISSVLGLGLRF